MDPAECTNAVKAFYGVEEPYATLYGEPGCDIGSDGQDYGFCSGSSNSKPTGCSARGTNYYSNTGA